MKFVLPYTMLHTKLQGHWSIGHAPVQYAKYVVVVFLAHLSRRLRGSL